MMQTLVNLLKRTVLIPRDNVQFLIYSYSFQKFKKFYWCYWLCQPMIKNNHFSAISAVIIFFECDIQVHQLPQIKFSGQCQTLIHFFLLDTIVTSVLACFLFAMMLQQMTISKTCWHQGKIRLYLHYNPVLFEQTWLAWKTVTFISQPRFEHIIDYWFTHKVFAHTNIIMLKISLLLCKIWRGGLPRMWPLSLWFHYFVTPCCHSKPFSSILYPSSLNNWFLKTGCVTGYIGNMYTIKATNQLSRIPCLLLCISKTFYESDFDIHQNAFPLHHSHYKSRLQKISPQIITHLKIVINATKSNTIWNYN